MTDIVQAGECARRFTEKVLKECFPPSAEHGHAAYFTFMAACTPEERIVLARTTPRSGPKAQLAKADIIAFRGLQHQNHYDDFGRCVPEQARVDETMHRHLKEHAPAFARLCGV